MCRRRDREAGAESQPDRRDVAGTQEFCMQKWLVRSALGPLKGDREGGKEAGLARGTS